MLTRENILSGWLHERLKEHADAVDILPIEELDRQRRAFVATRPCSGDLWVFGYGSLIWNPCAHVKARRTGQVYGFHRQFCLWTHLGRGTQECPGLMLGLENGGSVRGVALCLAEADLDRELSIIWNREMITSAYRPHWVRCHTEEGPVNALGFVINHQHDRYTGPISEDEIVNALAHASGPIGDCCDYLYNTYDHLQEIGIEDRMLRRLKRLVEAKRLAIAADAQEKH